MAAVEDSGQTPATYLEAIKSPDAVEWLKAIKAEHDTIKKTRTYRLIDLPQGRKALGSKTIFKLKLKADGTTDHRKARVVVQGCGQCEGINFFETYAPVLRYESLRFLLALAVEMDLEIHQMDVDSAFLQADLKDEIYIRQPEGFIDPKHPNKVWRLLKSLYGLKQAPLVWNQTIDRHLRASGFEPTKADPCVYVRWKDDMLAVIALYVDDLVIITHPNLLIKTKQVLSEQFPIKDLQEPQSILSIKILRNQAHRRLKLRQSGHIGSILLCADMSDCKAISTPMEPGLRLEKIASTPVKCMRLPYREIVRMLLYIACTTHWDIGYNITYLCRFVNGYNNAHWKAVKHLLRYLQGTQHQTIAYQQTTERRPENLILIGYSNADWASNRDDRKSISAYLFTLAGGPITWTSKKQKSISTSLCEAELYALSIATMQAIYLRQFFEPLRIPMNVPVPIYCNSQSALAVTE